MSDDIRVIDSDVHPFVEDGVSAIFPYISKGWRQRLAPMAGLFASFGARGRDDGKPAGIGIQVARGLVPWPKRIDAMTPTGGYPGSDPAYIGEHYFDQHNVEIGALVPVQPMLVDPFVNPDEAATIVQGFNDYFLEQWLPVDSRLRMHMVVAPQDPLRAAAEIRRLADAPGIVGVLVPPTNVMFGDRRWDPIYEAAQEVGMPVVIHPNGSEGDFQGGVAFAGGLAGSHVERYCLYFEIGVSTVVSLVFQGVFERFPDLKFVLTEYGWSWVPALLWRMDAAWKGGRANVPWVKRAPSEYVFNHVRFTSEPALEPPSDAETLRILENMHAERTLMFSSDYPHWDADQPEFVFRKIPPELEFRIKRENAIETYGDRLRLPVPA
jgi:predicted TIM-barrel fold metal-dependent hydrolase